MASERLKRHYDSKYAHEISGSDRVVSYTTTPADRFEACLFYLAQNFTGRDILELGAGDGTVARSVLKHGLSFRSYTVTDLSEIRATCVAKSIPDCRFEAFRLTLRPGLVH
jgi:spermidine synthase